MQVVSVDTHSLLRSFLDVPKLIYRDDENYVPHIRQEIEKALWNKGDKVGLWMVEQNGDYLGRIAAFVNKGKKGGLGFFESINNKEVAHILFDTGIQWLNTRSLTEVEVPVNFGERDKFWGLLVKGFDSPSYQENYNPPYYKDLIESYGFEPTITQSTQEITPALFQYDKIKEAAKQFEANENLRLECINRNNMRKYARDFVTVYNAAWREHKHFIPLTEEKVYKMMNSMKPVLREDLIWFTYDGDKPVAFYVSIIEMNEIFRHLNGNLNWLGKLKFLYYRWKVNPKRVRGLVFGVHPNYQGRGITSGMMLKVYDIIQNDLHLESSELAWIGDFNPRMLKFLRSIGAREIKQHLTYAKKL